ncbi:hypothetical protein [Arcticibacter sp. MXS-1]|uniref:hypothetical protein n=1 Tax=Arcticibacter sp. MXS-1 TaxID=3341726 RepID=UPI0035A86B55
MRSYRRWIAFHKAEPHISFFIESLLRKQIYLSSERDSVTKRRYVDYLQQSIQSPYTELKAHAVYQLCLSWYEEGKKYASSANRYIYPPRPNFQAQYQYYPAQARELYIRHRSFMSAYPPLSKVLFLMDSLTTLKSVQVEMDNVTPPGKEIPIKLRYKNVDTLYYRLTPAGLTQPKKTKSEHDAQLLALSVLEQGSFALPLPPDNNEHAVYLKLPAMHQGKYRLLFSGAPFGSQKASLNALSFQVSGIAAVNSGDEVFVLDRQSGSPVANAEIRAFKKSACTERNT